MTSARTPIEEFADRLHELCQEDGWPERGRQTRLAKAFAVSQQAARKWLNGETWPDFDRTMQIAAHFKVNINWLLQGSGLKRGEFIDVKAVILDEAIHRLPADMGVDLLDNLRAKLERLGKLESTAPINRYFAALDAYEQDLNRKPN